MIRSIEGLRGIAASLVALYHVYVYCKWGGFPAQWGVLRNAWLFVDMFFVISGYVMAAAYGERLRNPALFAGYMVRRFFRLYPLHIVTTVAVILAVLAVQCAKWLLAKNGMVLGGEPAFTTPFFDLDYFGLELLLLHGVGFTTPGLHNYPSWSISVEFWMYLVFGLLVLLVRTRWVRIAASAAIVAICIAWFLRSWSLDAAAVTLDVQGLPRGLLSFFLGVLVFHAWQALRWGAHPSGTSAGDGLLGFAQVAAGAFALYLVNRQDALGSTQLMIPFAFALLVLSLLPDRGLVARLLQTAPMQWLGIHSYAIYLTHITVQTVLDWPGRVVPEPAKHGVVLIFAAAVLALSALCYRFIEVPWRERGKRIAERIEGRSGVAERPAANLAANRVE